MTQVHNKKSPANVSNIFYFLCVLIIVGSSAWSYRNARDGRQKITGAKLNAIAQYIEVFYEDCGRYPDQLQELIEGPNCNRYKDHNMSFTDLWLNELIYRLPGKVNRDSFDLLSKGPDKMEGTDDDILSQKQSIR